MKKSYLLWFVVVILVLFALLFFLARPKPQQPTIKLAAAAGVAAAVRPLPAN